MIQDTENRRLLKGLKLCNGAPTLSHLSFVDDCLLFCQATTDDNSVLRQLLEVYEVASRQQLKTEKI